MKFFYLLSIAMLVHFSASAQVKPKLGLTIFSSSYTDALAVRNDGVNPWLYIVQRNGNIFIADSTGAKLPSPFLNISGRVLAGGERGLLGLAFDPDFATNRRFYVNYTRTGDGATVISSFKAVEGSPLTADASSEKILMTINQPFANHNGGDILFGKDGYLYIAMGDGGGAGDPGNRSQNRNDFHGKLLRIQIDSDSTYAIPSDNPFVDSANARPEIWALGLRNPWRISFDRLTDDLWIADVGQSAREEVNFSPAPRVGGLNYGWRCFEGELPYNTNGCGAYASYEPPIFTYNRTATGGRSITGGYVYRGTDHPDLYGYYVCADYLSRNFWMLKPNEEGLEVIPQLDVLNGVVSFGEDIFGELYLASFNGNIYKVGSLCSNFEIESITVEDATCEASADGSISVQMSGGVEPYVYTWSGGQTTNAISEVSAGTYSLTVTDANCKIDSVIVIGSGVVTVPEISRSGDTLFASGDPGSFQWLLNGNIIPDANEDFYLPTESGIYTVQWFNDVGCTEESEPFDFVTSDVMSASARPLALYPNPVDSRLYFDMANLGAESFTLQVFDVAGKLLDQRVGFIPSAGLDVSSFKNGLYLVTLTDADNGSLWSGKFIVSR